MADLLLIIISATMSYVVFFLSLWLIVVAVMWDFLWLSWEDLRDKWRFPLILLYLSWILAAVMAGGV